MRFAISALVVVAVSSIAVVAGPADREPDAGRGGTHWRLSCQQSVPALKLAHWSNNLLATKLRYHFPCPGKKSFCCEQMRLVLSSHCKHQKVVKCNLCIYGPVYNTSLVYNLQVERTFRSVCTCQLYSTCAIQITALGLNILDACCPHVQTTDWFSDSTVVGCVRCGHHFRDAVLTLNPKTPL